MMKEVIHDFSQWLAKKSYTPPKMEFYTHVEGLEKWAPIQPASKFIPDWYKRMPAMRHEEAQGGESANHLTLPTGNPPQFKSAGQTVKTCPGMQDIMTLGYTCPYWAHTMVEVSQNGDSAFSVSSTALAQYGTNNEHPEYGLSIDADYAKTSFSSSSPDARVWHEMLDYMRGVGHSEEYIKEWTKFQNQKDVFVSTEAHADFQYKEMKEQFPDEWAQTLMKINSVWRFKAPKGYSVMIHDPFYQFNPIYETLSGIIDSDVYPFFNLFVAIKQKNLKFQIPFGQPIAQYVPIKRESIPYEVRSATIEDVKQERVVTNALISSWGSSKGYRRLTKSMQKENKCPYS
jgi:hypothetical protein